MEWLRDGLFNVTDIKNNEMVQSFLGGWSWSHWCLCTRRPRKKGDVFGDLNTKLTKRKVV